MRDRVMKSEKDVKKYVKKILDDRGYFWWMPPANGFGKVGIADINAIRHGVFLAVETKFAANRPTAQQKAFLQSVAAESGFGFVVSDRTLDTFETWARLFDDATKYTSQGRKIPDEIGATLLECIRILTEPLVEPGRCERPA